MKRQELMSILTSNSDLAEFVKIFYGRLSIANPARETFPRELENRRLDAMARLLVGDEICAAVAFNGNNLLIATNRNNHKLNTLEYTIKYTGEMKKEGNELVLPIIIVLQYNQEEEVKIFGKSIRYVFEPERKILRPSPSDIEVRIKPSDHLIPSLSAVDFTLKLSLKEELTLDDSGFLNINPEGINNKISLDPLLRRAEIITEHLASVALLGKKEQSGECTSEQLERLAKIIQEKRHNILINSLTWEVAKWRKIDSKLRKFEDDSNLKELAKFIEALGKNFLHATSTFGETTTEKVKEWQRSVVELLLHNTQFEGVGIPPFIKEKPAYFMERVHRYFVDIEKLEQHTREGAKSDENNLANLLIRKAFEKCDSPQESIKNVKTIPLIIDDLEDAVHAEIRLLWHSINTHTRLEYIATSLLCCTFCNLMIKNHDIKAISGIHGVAYANWLLSVQLRSEERLRPFFGDSLYRRYENLKDENIQIKSKTYTKAAIAIELIQSVGSMSQDDLKSIGVDLPKLDKKGGVLADDSDDESTDVKYSHKIGFPSTTFIAPDGNCMFAAIIESINRINSERLKDYVGMDVNELRIRTMVYILKNIKEFRSPLENQLADIIKMGDFRGFSDKKFILQLKELHSGYIQTHIDSVILEFIQSNNLVELYLELLLQEGNWGGAVELAAITEMLEIGIILNTGSDTPLRVGNLSRDIIIRLNYSGDHYDLPNSEEQGHEHLSGSGLSVLEEKSYWYEYSRSAIDELLDLRLKDLGLKQNIKIIESGYVWNSPVKSAELLAIKVVQQSEDNIITLLPINIRKEHWSGVILEKAGNAINIKYLDSSKDSVVSSELQHSLVQQFARLYPEFDINFSVINVQQQCYNNCGPELIENFIWYLTGDRATQEDAVYVHSQLKAQALLNQKSEEAVKQQVTIKTQSGEYKTLVLYKGANSNETINAEIQQGNLPTLHLNTLSSEFHDLIKAILEFPTQVNWLIQQISSLLQKFLDQDNIFMIDVLRGILEDLEQSSDGIPFLPPRKGSDFDPDDFGRGDDGFGSGNDPRVNEFGIGIGLSGQTNSSSNSSEHNQFSDTL